MTTTSFESVSNYAVGSRPYSVAVGDFNGDGNQDLVTANINSDNVSVLLGDGSGSFSPASHYSVGSGPSAVVVGDFNGDDKDDLATVNRFDNTVTWRLGDGNGSFGSASSFSVGSSPYSVAVGKFNSDNNDDLAVVNSNDGTVTVLLGDASGNFSSAGSFSVGSSPYSVAVGDFNGDGEDDLAVSNYVDNNVSVLLGDGSGSFGSASSFSVGSNPLSVAVGDFNGDGKDDLATANSDDNNVSVLLGDGSGSFGSARSFSVGSNPQSVAVGDFNGDNNDDLVVANYDDDTVTLLLGDGSGSFGSANNYTVGSNPQSVAVGDFNGDGKDDLATANYGSDDVSVLLNNPIFPRAQLTHPSGDIFEISGTKNTSVKIKIKIKSRSSNLANELGVFNVDDSQGNIDGIAPDAEGYKEKALERSKIIFSVIANNPNGFSPDDLSRILEFDGGTQLRFYLKTNDNIVFSSVSNQEINPLSEGGYTISWKDGSRSNSVFDDLIVSLSETDEDAPIGVGLQGQYQGESLDLRDFTSDTLISASFSIHREASYNNYVGFYKVSDADGGIDTNGDGTADILVGQSGYLQAAINSRVTDIGLSVGNQGTGSSQSSFTGGGIYVPFLIINGGLSNLLDTNTSNDPTVYFTFLGANADKTQHVRLLGDNTFGFEDLSGGGDKDYNDVIVKVKLTAPVAV